MALDQDLAAPAISVVAMPPERWPDVERIYAAGIATGHATFEDAPPTWEQFDAAKLPGQRLVAVDGEGRVLGWAAAAAVSDRCVYAGVVEHSVYVDPAATGRGIGQLLLGALAESTERAGIWTIQSGIFPENDVSLRLHDRAGFRVVGTRARVGRMTYGPMAGRWRDVVLVERRSAVAGVQRAHPQSTCAVPAEHGDRAVRARPCHVGQAGAKVRCSCMPEVRWSGTGRSPPSCRLHEGSVGWAARAPARQRRDEDP